MRLFFSLCLAFAVVGSAARSAVASPPRSLDLSADRVVYYSNRFIVTGDGNVRVRLSDGTVIRGQTFAMDLKLNRYLIAGRVQIEGTGVNEPGAAFAGYPDLDRSYFLDAGGDPDRWTYNGLDFAHPHKGNEQPGDAFYLPDLTSEKPYVYATEALIVPKTSVKFANSRIYAAGIYLPTKSYLLNFSPNPNFAQNSLAGATAGFSLPFNGSGHSISELEFRYDTVNHGYLSFQQHFAWDQDWLVFSINPLTQEERQTNLIGYKRISPKVEARVFLQESSAQHGIIEPEVASAFENLSLNIGLKRSGISFNGDNYNTSIMPTVEFGLQKSYEHPADAQVSWSGSDTKIKGLPINFRLRGGIGLAHDGYHCGLGAPCPDPAAGIPDGGFILDRFGAAGTPVTTIWQHFFGLSLTTATFKIGNQTNPYFNLSGSFDKQRQWFSLPHHIDQTALQGSISKQYGRKLALLAIYSVSNTGDYYGARQLEFYPATGTIVTPFGTYDGFSAFRGFSTSRAWTGSAVITPNQYFGMSVSLHRFYDTPAPIPGAFGQPPVELNSDVRIRLAKLILMDVSRSYFFNFGNQRWTPQYGVSFGP
jgi:hypothetical protein